MVSGKSIEDKYTKLTDIEHVLINPGMYIGETSLITEKMWIYTDKFIKKEINYSAGFYKIFDEIIVNALDHYTRTGEVSVIKVDIKDNKISVMNDGPGIEVVVHKDTGLYVPEMIFGHLKTSSNYDKNEEKIVGGKHGLGSKLTAIFSKKFTIETIDTERKLKYKQVFENNLSKINKPKITEIDEDTKSFTKITFEPDFEKFGLTEITEDIIGLFHRRVIDISANTPKNVSVYFNGKKVNAVDFEKYCKMYLDDINPDEKNQLIYTKVNERWEIAIAPLPNSLQGFECISFVNGINTSKGGKHVDYITEQVIDKITEFIKKKKKDAIIKSSSIKQNLFLFIKSFIVNPNFDSQTKETLTTPIKKFGSVCELPDAFLKKLYKTSIIDTVSATLEINENKELSKTDGSKTKRLSGIPKLDDANKAGTRDSNKCMLILTEGDSAKSMAISGISAIKNGRDYYGVFPLRGKLINVRDTDIDKIKDNEEIINLKKILGLQNAKEYKNTDELRYGSVIIMTDADVDGSHIKGLIMNFFDTYYPSLLKIDGFLKEFRTPIIKATKNKNVIMFYTLTEYYNWKENNDTKGYQIKYYKGLGTNDAKEAREYFSNITNSLRNYIADNEFKTSLELAFKGGKKQFADKRKEWLANYDKQEILDTKDNTVSITDFINKDLKHFSNYDNIRSIPRIEDGLKPSLRKIVYATLIKRWGNSDIKVSQFSGFVSEKTSYAHGENSLVEAIIGLAQDFTGSNNMNLLKPKGMFGTRILGGKDSASPRYIFTQPMEYFNILFHPEDLELLNYQDDDGFPIEPEFYMPILPLILINGSLGIGTGWSTEIPQYNPVDIIKNIKRLLKGKTIDELNELIPYYRGFTGTIEKDTNGKFICSGKYSINEKGDNVIITITELPVGVWTDKYKEFLEDLMNTETKKTGKKGKISEKKKTTFIKSYDNLSTDTSVKFIITMNKDKFTEIEDKITEVFKLQNIISTSNMVLFDSNYKLKKYNNPNEILVEYFNKRLEYYTKRKENMLFKLNRLLKEANARLRFIKEIMNEELIVYKRSKIDICKDLKEREYPTETEIGLNSNVDVEEITTKDYNYLINMPIYSFTKERLEKLKSEITHYTQEIDTLQEKTTKDLWINDLDEITQYIL